MMRFFDIGTGRYRWLDTAQRNIRMAFRQRAEAQHAMRQLMFERIGVNLHTCSTDDDVFAFFLRVSRYE